MLLLWGWIVLPGILQQQNELGFPSFAFAVLFGDPSLIKDPSCKDKMGASFKEDGGVELEGENTRGGGMKGYKEILGEGTDKKWGLLKAKIGEGVDL